MITMLMECPSHMGVLHVNISGHMLLHKMTIHTITLLIVRANKPILS